MAIQKGDIESVLFLLSVSVDVNSRVQNELQTTPLHLAVATGNEMLVRSIILAGARVNIHYSSYSLLIPKTIDYIYLL
jgi:rabankyrin-5